MTQIERPPPGGLAVFLLALLTGVVALGAFVSGLIELKPTITLLLVAAFVGSLGSSEVRSMLRWFLDRLGRWKL